MATDDARDYVLAFENDKAEAARIAVASAEKLQNGQTNLLDVVKALGEYINSEDDKVRSRAINYLTAVISVLPPKYLSRQQIQVLNSFLSSRIEDGGAIEGLSKLQSLDRYTKEMTQELMRATIGHFSDMQTRPQSARYKVYTLVNELLSGHRQAVHDMGDESLTGCVQVFAGEKDPRNLMMIFSMLRVFMVEWDITAHLSLVFDAAYAYFPITFRPPPNDPYGITAQDLKDRLEECLASTGLLAPQTFPNLLDRLDSTSDLVKKDVLSALAACALNYGTHAISQYSITLWDAVKFEVLQAQEPFLADEALQVIKSIAVCLSTSTGPHAPTSDSLNQYLKPLTKECLEHLQEPTSRQAKASGDILQAAASASLKSFQIVLQNVGPALLTLQQSSEGTNNQRAILTAVNQLFEASIEVYGSWNAPSEKNPTGQENLFMEFKERLVAIYSRALMSTVREEVSYRLTALKGLLLLAQMSGLLAENETGLLVQYFNDIILDEESYGRDELKQRAISALADIAKFRPRLITDITFPKFIARLPETEEQASQLRDYQDVLECLAEISLGRDLLETLVRRLLNKLDILIQSPHHAKYDYTCAVISTIYFVLHRSSSATDAFLAPYFDRVVVGICQKFEQTGTGPLDNEMVLNLLGRLMNLIVRHGSAEQKERTAANVYALFNSDGAPGLSAQTAQLALTRKPNASIISAWLLASIPKVSALQTPDTDLILLCEALAASAKTSSPACVVALLGQIALLANKHISDDGALTALHQSVIRSIPRETQSKDQEFSIRLTFALSRAIIVRVKPQTFTTALMSLVGLLDHSVYTESVSRFAAFGFGTILAPDELLSKENDAVIRLLAPQRVFQTLVPELSTKFKDSTAASEQRETYLIALSGILGTVSSEIVMPELPTLLPLLLQSLEISDQNQSVKVATLETMIVVITKNLDALIQSGHISALVRRLLVTATLPKAVSKKPGKTSTQAQQTVSKADPVGQRNVPRTRTLALKCLALLPVHVGSKTPNPLLPLKKEVMQGLATGALDDPKRDVRKEAVDARASWSRGVDGSDSDDEDD